MSIYSRDCTQKVRRRDLGCFDGESIRESIMDSLGSISNSVSSFDGAYCLCGQKNCNDKVAADIIPDGVGPTVKPTKKPKRE